MSSKIKLVPMIIGGRIMCKLVREIDPCDGVRIENAVENTMCAVEALLYREGVFNDGSIEYPCAKSNVVIRFKHRVGKYTCYVSSNHSLSDCKSITDFVQSLYELVRDLLSEVQKKSEVTK